MNRYILFVVACLFFKFSLSASAQNHFEPGYILTTELDTLRGLIDYRNWNKNPEKITFKSPVSDKPVEYETPDIAGFGVHGENYIKAAVRICISSDKDDELTYSASPEFAETTAFLMVVSRGTKSLYYLRDQRQKLQLYVGNAPGAYELLINYRYKVITAAGSSIMVQNRYKERLRSFFADCPEITSNMKAVTYSEHSLSKIFKDYYTKCSKEVSHSAYEPEHFVLQTGALIGLTSAKLSFTSVALQYLDKLSFPHSQGFTGGIFLNVVIPRTQKRFSIYNDLTFSNYKATDKREDYVSDQRYTRTTSTMGPGYLKLTNMVRYQIPAGKISFFVNLGVSQGMMITVSNKLKTEKMFYTEQPVFTEEKLLDDMRKYEQGFVGGFGATTKKYGVEFRYELSNGMSDYANLNSTVKRLSVLLSYRFK